MGWHDATHVFCWPSPRAVAVLKRDFDLLLFWEIKTKEKDDSFFSPNDLEHYTEEPSRTSGLPQKAAVAEGVFGGPVRLPQLPDLEGGGGATGP